MFFYRSIYEFWFVYYFHSWLKISYSKQNFLSLGTKLKLFTMKIIKRPLFRYVAFSVIIGVGGLSSCSTYQHSSRVSSIAEDNIVVTNKIAVDLDIDLSKTCRGRSGRHKSVKDAKDEAYFDAIQTNAVHVLVDPIYSVTTTKTLFGKLSTADVVGFAGYYKNSRSLESINDALKAEQIQKDKVAFEASLKNYKSFIAIGNIAGSTETEKYRMDENCKPCTIYKNESKTKVTEEFFKLLSKMK